MTATIIDLGSKATREMLAWHDKALARHLDNHERAAIAIVQALDSGDMAAILRAKDEAEEAQGRFVAARTARDKVAADLVAGFEREIIGEVISLTSRTIAAEGSLEAGCLIVQQRMKESLRAEVTGDPSLFDRVLSTLRATDARWKTFHKNFEKQERPAHGA